MANNNSRNNRSNGNRNNSNNNNDRRKRSGAQTGVFGDGKKWTNGWNKSSVGFTKIACFQWDDSTVSTSKSGREWLTVMVKVQRQMQPETVTFGLMDRRTGAVVIKSMGVTLNPKAPNGGYCGRYGGK